MSVETVARRYAIALADVVTKQGNADAVRRELDGWDALMGSNPELVEVFRNPTIPYEDKRKVLDALIARTRVMPLTANFLQVLLQNQRLADLHEVVRSFARELETRAGIVTAHITTARPLPQNTQEALKSRLSALAQSGVRLEFAVDENLIGGVVARIGSTVYDGSVRNQLQQIKEQMIGAG